MTNNQRLRQLKDEHGLTRRRIAELTRSGEDAVKKWLRLGEDEVPMPAAKLELLEMKLEKIMYKIYAQPKNWAEGLPHYSDKSYNTKAEAQAVIDEQLEDGIGKYWNLSIRETEAAREAAGEKS